MARKEKIKLSIDIVVLQKFLADYIRWIAAKKAVFRTLFSSPHQHLL